MKLHVYVLRDGANVWVGDAIDQASMDSGSDVHAITAGTVKYVPGMVDDD